MPNPNDRIVETGVVPIALNDQRRTRFAPGAAGEGIVHEDDVAALDLHGVRRLKS